MTGVDSNVLIYGLRVSDDPRHHRSLDVLGRIFERGQLFLPLQAVGESFHVLVRKARIEPLAASRLVGTYASFAQVAAYGHDDVLAAMEAVRQHRLCFWDAPIWAVCERCGFRTLLTEDMQSGRVLGYVTFVNPFGEQAPRLLGH